MIDTTAILTDLRNTINRHYKDSVKSVILFGSQAQGTAHDNSDFDILILFGSDYTVKDENNILDICYEIDLKYNIIIDAHILSSKELHTMRGKQPIFTNALQKGIYA